MPLTAAKCTNCGANLQVDSALEAAVCPHCHTPYIVQDAINQYVINNVTKIENLHADVMNVTEDSEATQKAKAGEAFLQLGDPASAREAFTELTKKHPYEYRGWWGLVRLETEEFTKKDLKMPELTKIRDLYKKALTVCEDPALIQETYEAYDAAVISRIAPVYEELSAELAEAEKARDEAYDALERGCGAELAVVNREIAALESNKVKGPKPDLTKDLIVAGILFACVLVAGFKIGKDDDNFLWSMLMVTVLFSALSYIPFYFIRRILPNVSENLRQTYTIIEWALLAVFFVLACVMNVATPLWLLYFVVWTAFEYLAYLNAKKAHTPDKDRLMDLSEKAKSLQREYNAGMKAAEKAYDKAAAPVRQKDVLGVLKTRPVPLAEYLAKK